MHADEHPIDVPLVRGLVDAARPEWAGLPLSPLSRSGSSNALFRLGEELVVRLPRQPGGSATVEKEARWLPWVAPALRVRVPEVVAVGRPGGGYPERWSVLRWLDGEVPEVDGSGRSGGLDHDALARDLAAVVTALRGLEVPEAARADPALRWYRGESLARQDAGTRANVEACRDLPGLDLDLDAALSVWESALDLPDPPGGRAPSWYHGDLLAENLLVEQGRLAAVLDFGSLGVGEPTVDLMVAWELLPAGSRRVFREATGVDDVSWARGRAWALAVALMTFPYYWRTMPQRCADRLVMARAALADASACT